MEYRSGGPELGDDVEGHLLREGGQRRLEMPPNQRLVNDFIEHRTFTRHGIIHWHDPLSPFSVSWTRDLAREELMLETDGRNSIQYWTVHRNDQNG
jgi:hypothetical protein